MKVTGFLKLINKGNAWSFILLFMRHPFNLIPTFLATYQCVEISNEHYGTLHHKNNKTNAFRHALWTPLEKEMDLHNNHIGRKLFIQENEESVEKFVHFLKEKVESSQLIASIEDIKKHSNNLVHIEEL